MDAICPSAPQAQAPTGILESTAQVPVPIPTAPKGLIHKKSTTPRAVLFLSIFLFLQA